MIMVENLRFSIGVQYSGIFLMRTILKDIGEPSVRLAIAGFIYYLKTNPVATQWACS
ncbi:hypothetical protein EMIT0P294_10808 [Pseudomonas sp. IT-P294]